MKFLFALSIIANIVCILVEANVDDEVVFKKIGSYLSPCGTHTKSYWVPQQFRAYWVAVRSICQAYGFDIVSLDTLDEMEAVARMCQNNQSLFTEYVHIGGIARTGKSKTDWYWVNSKSKVSYDMPWMDHQPDNYGNNEMCMSLARNHQFKVNDIPCYGGWEVTFICESKVMIPQYG